MRWKDNEILIVKARSAWTLLIILRRSTTENWKKGWKVEFSRRWDGRREKGGTEWMRWAEQGAGGLRNSSGKRQLEKIEESVSRSQEGIASLETEGDGLRLVKRSRTEEGVDILRPKQITRSKHQSKKKAGQHT